MGNGAMNNVERSKRLFEVSRAFRPAAPIDRADLFAGRTRQISEVIQVMAQPGQHAVIYGERGVGKTSLTTVIVEFLGDVKGLTLRTNCDGTDDFSTVWRKLLVDVAVKQARPGLGFNPIPQEIARSVVDLLPEGQPLAPEAVRRILTLIGGSQLTVIVIDEFDRLTNHGATTLFADTIKLLSDRLVPVTLVLVGVADSVDQLITEHRSVERALVQIHMPRMSRAELNEIVDRGLEKVGLMIQHGASARITELSQGLPHYTHALALGAAISAVSKDSTEITFDDVNIAIATALERAQESIKSAYHSATGSARENLYAQVLLGCALAREDDLGYFAASDVRAPLTAIMGKPYAIPAFARHLKALCEAERGQVLQKKGSPRNFRFRFTNPLLEPHVIMRGLSSGMLTNRVLEQFTAES